MAPETTATSMSMFAPSRKQSQRPVNDDLRVVVPEVSDNTNRKMAQRYWRTANQLAYHHVPEMGKTFNRNSEFSTEAGLKYFVFGAVIFGLRFFSFEILGII